MSEIVSEKYTDLRKVQALACGIVLAISLPKKFTKILSISKGDFLKCTVEGKKLIMEKAEI